jgi:hypothetical protein
MEMAMYKGENKPTTAPPKVIQPLQKSGQKAL